MFKKLLLAAGSLLLVQPALMAQTTYLQLNQEDYQLFDRFEALDGKISNEVFTADKPIARKNAVQFLERIRDTAPSLQDLKEGDRSGPKLSAIDRYNLAHAISVSGEWASNGDGAINSKHPWFKGTFYRKQPDFGYVKTPDFFIVANPVIGLQLGYEKGNDNPLYLNSRGAEVRGWVSKKVGFYTYFTDNQERLPSYVDDWTVKHQALPGMDYYQNGSALNKYDYIAARGYIDFAAVKDHINLTLGYDKHFIGDGMTSLLLSDFSAPSTFLRITTHIWHLNYENLYLELTPQYKRGGDQQLPHKYATMHHLSWNATKWLNLGIFEATIFDRADRYPFSYMNPIILYRAIERANGSPDNVLLGLTYKVIPTKGVQVYGQAMLDEFQFKQLTSGRGWWANKYGVQLGAKYFNAFGIANLDLQGELNLVRPFTYSHFDSLANYTHYNQPLAHPLGAGFRQLIGVARYQPIHSLYLTAKAMYYNQGVDTGSKDYGSNIFTPYGNRSEEYGVTLINGVKTTGRLFNLNASYEVKENVFFDLGFTHRKFTYDDNLHPANTTNYFYAGLRINFVRRDYDFY